MLTIPWNEERDGQFPVPPQGAAFYVGISSRVETLSFPGLFIEEKVRINDAGKLELLGALWLQKGNKDGDFSVDLDLERGSGKTVVLRPQWWNGSRYLHRDAEGGIATTRLHAGWLSWSARTGFILGPTDAGSGAIAMEAIQKLPASTNLPAPLYLRSNAPKLHGTDWIPSVGWDDWKEGEADHYRCGGGTPNGTVGPEGLHPFKKHPDFFIPWESLFTVPG